MPSSSSRTARRERRRVRYAAVGLGHIAQVAVLPAFGHARRNSELVALVSGEPEKLDTLARHHRVPHAFGYDELDRRLAEGIADAVYLAVPNHEHHDFALRALRAGVHVLCEKPLAVTEQECEELIQVAREQGVRLMVAYRLHFEAANTRAMEIARSGELGDLRLFDSVFSMQVRPDNVRLVDTEQGGGPLYDLGVYCINAARYLFGAEPTEVLAASVRREQDERFRDTEEMVSAILRFPGERLATFTCSFGAADVSSYRLVGTRGELRLEPAYEYQEALTLHRKVNGRSRKRTFRKRDQFAPELLHFSECILEDREPEPSGLEGLIDVHIIRSVLEAAARGRSVSLRAFEKRRRPGPELELRRPPVRKPPVIGAKSASL